MLDRGRGGGGGGRGIAALKGPQRHKSLIVPSVARDRHLDASRIPFICISVLLGLPLRRVYLFIRLAIYRLNVASFSRPSSPLEPLRRSRTCACTAIPRPGSPSLEVVALSMRIIMRKKEVATFFLSFFYPSMTSQTYPWFDRRVYLQVTFPERGELFSG